MRIGVDTGGTFTDFVAMGEDGQIIITKSSTTPKDLTQGTFNCFAKAGLDRLSGVSQVLHGSTTVINTIIQRVGARTALLTTRGMRDVYEVGRSNRPDSYNLFFHRPRPLITREWRLEVTERLTAKGDILVPLDEAQVIDIVALLKKEDLQAVAVCFLHSYVNPVHEKRVGEILRREMPGVYVTLSHELMREWREYERTSTTVLNAYVGPVMSGYLDRLEQRFQSHELGGPVLIMQSNGGCMSTEIAKRQPIATTESGPVAGVIGAARLASVIDHPAVIAFDMGGTTAKTAFVEKGNVPLAPGCYIGGYANGQPMMLPVVDIIEIGAGGGSIAWVDEVGALGVGPKSAGADPGPVCYGQGGTEPTVTDANLVLGRLNARNFLGGEMRLDEERAGEAMKHRVADPKGMNLDEAADSILQIVITSMSLAVRGVSVEKGVDPRDCIMVAFGGAGPLHAVEVARELRIPKVIIPQMPGHFSALGMLVTDLRHDYVRTYLHNLRLVDFNEIAGYMRDFEEQARATLLSEGAVGETINCSLFLDLRYQGQNHVLTVPVTFEELRTVDPQEFINRYDATHMEKYGQAAPGDVVEVVNLRMVATARPGKDEVPVFCPISAHQGQPQIGHRSVYLGAKWGWRDTAVYQREELGAGFTIEGPAIVEEKASTTIIFPKDRLNVDARGNLVVEVA